MTCPGVLMSDQHLLGLCLRCSLQAEQGEMVPPAVRDEESQVWSCERFVPSEPVLMEARTS